MNIVLAHGILGLGALPWVRHGYYFNGVRTHLEALGHQVLEPSVAALGELDVRSAQLALAIDTWRAPEPVCVIAHSMGGLDIRRALARSAGLRARVRTVACISTPLLGSPVADAVIDATHPLHRHLPDSLLHWLRPAVGALQDLRTRSSPHDPDVPDVRYLEIACDATLDPSSSPLFNLTRAIGQLSHERSDGVVTLASATGAGRDAEQIWPVDHGGAIGWPSGQWGLSVVGAVLQAPAGHLQRYAGLLKLL
jgi:triacylglycerol lipase